MDWGSEKYHPLLPLILLLGVVIFLQSRAARAHPAPLQTFLFFVWKCIKPAYFLGKSARFLGLTREAIKCCSLLPVLFFCSLRTRRFYMQAQGLYWVVNVLCFYLLRSQWMNRDCSARGLQTAPSRLDSWMQRGCFLCGDVSIDLVAPWIISGASFL